MEKLLYVDLGSGVAAESLGGGAFTWPKWTEGDDVTLALRLRRKSPETGNAYIEVWPTVVELRISLGRVDARPAGGTCRLWIGEDTPVIGTNVTAPLASDATASQIQTALEAIGQTVSVTAVDGSFILLFDADEDEVQIRLRDNLLSPRTSLRVTRSQVDGQWQHELRFRQTPVAFTDSSERILPPPPTINRITAGVTVDDVAVRNEVQELVVPPTFRGTYYISRESTPTALLSQEDDVETLAEKLARLADEDGEFVVSNPITGSAYIEFAGSMAGTAQALMTVTVEDAPPGDLTTTLSLATAELNALLRNAVNAGIVGDAKLLLEIEADIQDEQDEDTVYTRTLLRQEIIVQRQLILPEDSVPANIDWLRPVDNRSYVPFTPDQVITGNQHYVTTLGDGVATTFVVDHNLGTGAVHVALRENIADGRVLALPLEYNLVINDEDSVTITLQADAIAVPGVAGLAVLITAAGPTSAFQSHTHTMGQIDGLPEALAALGSRVDALEDLVPTGALTERTVATGTPVFEVLLPRFVEVYPSRETLDIGADQTIADIPAASLPRDGGLVPAVHAATATDLESGTELPAITTGEEGNANTVLKNLTGAAILIMGGRGRRSVQLQPNEHAANDGSRWYRVSRVADGENTWYPTDFDRVLFEVAVSSKVLIAKRTLEMDLGFRVALRSLRQAQPSRWAWDTLKNTKAQWELVIEHGSKTSEANPATTGTNLKGITWDATPILAHPILLTTEVTTHQFGARIARAANGDLSASAIYYGAAESSASVPASADFLLRARLRRFDIQDGISDPSGLILLQGLDQALGDAGNTTLGALVIR